MDAAELRRSGIIVSSALLVGALLLVFEPTLIAHPTPPAAEPLVSFVVRFGPTHPLAEAQALAARGDLAAAARLARERLDAGQLQGLCFDRFTQDGEAIVLAPCTPPRVGAAGRISARWSARLEAMAGIDYAEANVILNTEGAPHAPAPTE